MEIYEKVSTNLNFVEREKETRKFWEENKIFEKSIDIREKGGKHFLSVKRGKNHRVAAVEVKTATPVCPFTTYGIALGIEH